MALKLTQSPMLLKLLIRIFCREEKHIHEAAILKVLESFIKRLVSFAYNEQCASDESFIIKIPKSYLRLQS